MFRKLTMVLLAVCIFAGMAGACAFAAQAEENLIINGGFESNDGVVPVGWFEKYGARDFATGMVKLVNKEDNPAGVRSGNYALQIGGDDKVIVGDEPVSQTITDFTPGTVYNVSGFMRAEALAGGSTDIKFEFFLAWFDETDTRIAYSQTIDSTPAVTGVWKEFSGVTRAPQNAVKAVLKMRYSGNIAFDVTSCGTYYWDDISLVPVQEADNLFDNPGFEVLGADGKTPTGWNDRISGDFTSGIVKVVDRISTPDAVRSGERALMIGGNLNYIGNEPIQQTITDFTAGGLYSVSGWLKVQEAAENASGTVIAMDFFFEWLNASGSRISYSQTLDSTPAVTGVWKEISAITQVPEGAVSGRMKMRYAGTPADGKYGVYYWDDLSFSKTANLLENGSFEQGKVQTSGYFQPFNWVNRHVRDFSSRGVMTAESANVYSGVYALCLGNDEVIPSAQGVVKTNINYVEEGQLYRFSAWVKVGKEAEAGVTKRIYLSWNSTYRKPVNGSSYDDTAGGDIWLSDNSDRIGVTIVLPSTTDGWEEVSFYAMAPQGAEEAILIFNMNGNNESKAGNTYIDAMRFEKVDRYITGGDFESGAAEWKTSDSTQVGSLLTEGNENTFVHFASANKEIKATIPNDYMMRGKALELTFDYRFENALADSAATVNVKFASGGPEALGTLINGDGEWRACSMVFTVPENNSASFEICLRTKDVDFISGDYVDFDNVYLTFFTETGTANVFSDCMTMDTNTLHADNRGALMDSFTAGESGTLWYYPQEGETAVRTIVGLYKKEGAALWSIEMVSLGGLEKTEGGRAFSASFTIPENLEPASEYLLRSFVWDAEQSPLTNKIVTTQPIY